MKESEPLPLRGVNEDAALRSIVEGTATETGERFFVALVKNLARALNCHGAWVTEYLEEAHRLRSYALWLNNQYIPEYEYDLEGTPCQLVIEQKRLVHVEENVAILYPGDNDLAKFDAVSFMAMPLLDSSRNILGHLAVLDTRPMPKEPQCLAIIRIFAARAAAELQRLRAEEEIREREEKLSRLVDGAMDAIVEFDAERRISQINPAANKVLQSGTRALIGSEITSFLAPESRAKFDKLCQELDSRPAGEQFIWIPSGLAAQNANGDTFPVEGTLSRRETHHGVFYTLILRNVSDRVQAERKIQSLTAETRLLREELKAIHDIDRIVGESEPLCRVLQDIQQVAETDSTVLILGETGTGKELIARAIHANSRRRDKPFIKVNCAAVPATLIESEFFGHEQGAFTGATRKRSGRFALADGGTIFLDEIGELPLDLQAKLLRVLQEGEFEPVGSSDTVKVNVRVIAATNRDLQQAVEKGEFREDLFYRLNVFPLSLPPLRERRDDIPLLAESFIKKYASQIGRSIEPLGLGDIQRLKAYNWPGNVRELENVIERAIITSTDGRLNLERALPEYRKDDRSPSSSDAAGVEAATGAGAASGAEAAAGAAGRILTVREMQEQECDNIRRALEAANGKVAGKNGAAALLGMNPSTLNSRIKALGIQRHQ